MIHGEGTETIQGVTPKEVFEFVMDPATYTKADTKILWVHKVVDTDDGMIAIEEGKAILPFLKGSVVTRYRWSPDYRRIDVTLVHGFLKSLHAWFEIEAVEGGTKVRHVEEFEPAGGPLAWIQTLLVGPWLARSVGQEVREIKRLLEAGERGKWPQ